MKEYKLKIKVTKEILERSKMCGYNDRKMTESCAVALACKEIFNVCYVSYKRIIIPNSTIYIPISNEVSNFIALFDRTVPKERPNLPEFEFEVTLPQAYIDSINIDEIKEVLERFQNIRIMCELKITKEKVLEAASKCSQTKETLKALFPEAFEDDKYLDLSVLRTAELDVINKGYQLFTDESVKLLNLNSGKYPKLIEIRNAGEYTFKGFFLETIVNWEILKDSSGCTILLPTRKI